MALEKMLVKHCAATLASMKMANLFNMFFTSEEELKEQMLYWNTCMNKKGIRLFLLRAANGRALIYVYREKKLQENLHNVQIRKFLKDYGYENKAVEQVLQHLKNRILQNGNFPHEIGVFLDYPLKDVEGFIKNKGKNYKYSGLWKVYYNEEEAKRKFAKYKKCGDVYIRLWEQGKSVMQLTVAA